MNSSQAQIESWCHDLDMFFRDNALHGFPQESQRPFARGGPWHTRFALSRVTGSESAQKNSGC
jgi:hypothetical protein